MSRYAIFGKLFTESSQPKIHDHILTRAARSQ